MEDLTDGGSRANLVGGATIWVCMSPRSRDTHQPEHMAPSHNRSTTGDGASPEGRDGKSQANQWGSMSTSTGQKQPPTMYLLQPPTTHPSKYIPKSPETSPLKQPTLPYTLKSDQPNPGRNGDLFNPFRVETTQQVHYDKVSRIVSDRDAPTPRQLNRSLLWRPSLSGNPVQDNQEHEGAHKD